MRQLFKLLSLLSLFRSLRSPRAFATRQARRKYHSYGRRIR